MKTPHIAEGSELDRLLDKRRPTERDVEEMVSLLSSIEDPTPDEQRLLDIARKVAASPHLHPEKEEASQ